MAHSITLKELFALALFLGAFCHAVGALCHTVVLFRKGALRQPPWGALALVVGTRLVAMMLALVGWRFWPFPHQDVLLGPVLLPALLAEAVASPLALKLAGYKLRLAAA